MTDNTSSPSGSAVDSASASMPDAAGKTAGTLLREARLACGMDLSELARILKVPERKLEALEADRYAELQSMTFVRALALSACRVMRAEAAPVLALLPQQTQMEVLDSAAMGLNRPLQEFGSRRLWGGMLREQRAGTLITLAFVVGAVVLWNLPSGWVDQVRARFSQPAAATTVVEEPVLAPAPSTEPIASDRLPATGASPWPASGPAAAGLAPPAALPGAVSTVPAASVARSASSAYRSASGAWVGRSARAAASAPAPVRRTETPAVPEKPAVPTPAPAPAASQ
ncbi:helix-turn-helix domain-containing protein [Vitreoscilla filiformis]|uniref:helix-turn-helix domain-containing protein n=1 Tax=Vitreoscilla filiformis TaxID=63 RepID=UPI000B7A2A00|nr:helix-turn-helix domain-containing protein [Vitreoscilla filiformis]